MANRFVEIDMVKRLIVRGASKREAHEAPTPKQHPIALIELITTAALALSTAVAATAVSIGIARADVLGAVTNGDTTPLAIALCFGLLLAAMGALTAVVAIAPRRE
jgi:protein-S-isoprenylcysteine O-methyltransferase Ste14